VGTPEYTLVGRPLVGAARVRLQVEEQAKDAKVRCSGGTDGWMDGWTDEGVCVRVCVLGGGATA
jgi:hypothetical protein